MRYNYNPLHRFRNPVLSISTILAIPVLGLLAHLTRVTRSRHATSFEILGLITAVLTLLIFPLMLLVPRILLVVTETFLTTIMWALWVITTALIIRASKRVLANIGNCSAGVATSLSRRYCRELHAAEALSIIIFALLTLYLLYLLTHASTYRSPRNRRRGVWFNRMNEPYHTTAGTTTGPLANETKPVDGGTAAGIPATTV